MNLQENIIRIKEVMGIYTSDQNIIVEASKKEILIDKLGFSNENAEVLANAAGPFSVWLGNKLINDGAFEYSKEYLNKVGIMNHVLSKITSIMDWIRVGLNGNAKPYQNMFFEWANLDSFCWFSFFSGNFLENKLWDSVGIEPRWSV